MKERGVSGLDEDKMCVRDGYQMSDSDENAFLWPWLSWCEECESKYRNAGVSGLDEDKMSVRDGYQVSDSDENAFLWPWLSWCE